MLSSSVDYIFYASIMAKKFVRMTIVLAAPWAIHTGFAVLFFVPLLDGPGDHTGQAIHGPG